MNKLRIVLIAANVAAAAVLLAIPIGKLLGALEQPVDAAAMIGWLIFFVPLLTSALGLCGIQFSQSALTRSMVLIAMPGSFLVAFVSLYTFWQGPPEFVQIGIGMMVLLGFNVVALWQPFQDRLEPPNSQNRD